MSTKKVQKTTRRPAAKNDIPPAAKPLAQPRTVDAIEAELAAEIAKREEMKSRRQKAKELRDRGLELLREARGHDRHAEAIGKATWKRLRELKNERNSVFASRTKQLRGF